MHVELSRMMSKLLDQLGMFRQRCCRIRSCDYLHSTAFPIFSYQRTIFYTLPMRYRISVFLRQPSTSIDVEGLCISAKYLHRPSFLGNIRHLSTSFDVYRQFPFLIRQLSTFAFPPFGRFRHFLGLFDLNHGYDSCVSCRIQSFQRTI